jgi:hypothetical protein
LAARTTVRAGRKGLAPSVAHVRPFVARGLTSRAADTVEVVRSTFRSVLGTPHVVACCRCNQPTPFIGASQMSNRKSATASKSRPSNTKRAAASKRGRRPKAAARAQRKKQAVVRSRKENHLRLVSGEATEAPIEVHNETKPDASEAENRTTRAAELDASLQPSLQKDSGAGENSRRETFDFTLPFATMLAYQAKLLEVAQENMQFGLEFIQKLATVRSPFALGSLVGEFTRRRIAMTAKHSQELAAYSLWRIGLPERLTA